MELANFFFGKVLYDLTKQNEFSIIEKYLDIDRELDYVVRSYQTKSLVFGKDNKGPFCKAGLMFELQERVSVILVAASKSGKLDDLEYGLDRIKNDVPEIVNWNMLEDSIKKGTMEFTTPIEIYDGDHSMFTDPDYELKND